MSDWGPHRYQVNHPRRPVNRIAAWLFLAAVATVVGPRFMSRAWAADAPGGGSIFDDDYKPKPIAPVKPPVPEPDTPIPPPRLKPVTPPVPVPLPNVVNPGVAPAAIPVAGRVKVPATASLAPIEKMIRDVFKDEYANHNAVGKEILAQALLNEARHGGQETVAMYVLFREARDNAIAAGDADAALEAVRGLRDWFDIPAAEAAAQEKAALMSAVDAMLASPPNNSGDAAEHRAAILVMAIAERELLAGQYGAAQRTASQAESIARRAADPPFLARVHARAEWMQAVEAEYARCKDSFATIKQNIADPAANLALGRFYAFAIDRPDLGIPMLARCSDPALKGLAVRDLAPKNNNEECALGDAWALLGKSLQHGIIREGIMRRSAWWYDSAAVDARGLSLLSIQKRSLDSRHDDLKHGLRCEFFQGAQFESKLFSRIDPRIEFNWRLGLPDPDLMNKFSIRWTGYIKANAAGTYRLVFVHDDGIRVWLDDSPILDKWGDVSRDEIPVKMTGGLQSLKIDYRQLGGEAHMGFGWVAPGARKPVAVPTEAFFHEASGEPAIISVPPPQIDGTVTLAAGLCQIHHPEAAFLAENPDHIPVIAYWGSARTWLSWYFDAPTGDFDVDLEYGCDGNNAGAQLITSIGNAHFPVMIEDTGGWQRHKTVRLGRVHLTAGDQYLRLDVTAKPRGSVMEFCNFLLIPAR